MANITSLPIKSASTSTCPSYKDYSIAPPTNKGELDRVSMLHYVKAHGTTADIKWFISLVKENTIMRSNNLKTSQEYKTIKLSAVREEFAIRFFYSISDKAKREANRYDFFEDFADLEALLHAEEVEENIA